ncbi:hypothetical protein [Actinomadura viridis]|uniref:Uncharacterized protein n=1 Tax=Actinomadura viridis TaxID=58110 RepID=A0A931DIA9_9ACTN|nr:hypothetical protein [Actinomadura viridis]MBG6089259.1 hypothetical protein [Actinomadura viridis]
MPDRGRAAAPEPPRKPPAEPGGHRRLLQDADADGFRDRWREVQTGFVDDPREAVSRADALASEVVDALGEALTRRRRELERSVDAGAAGDGQASETERLRLALRRYRELVDQMLAT